MQKICIFIIQAFISLLFCGIFQISYIHFKIIINSRIKNKYSSTGIKKIAQL